MESLMKTKENNAVITEAKSQHVKHFPLYPFKTSRNDHYSSLAKPFILLAEHLLAFPLRGAPIKKKLFLIMKGFIFNIAIFLALTALFALPLAEARKPEKSKMGIRTIKRQLRFDLIHFPKPRFIPDLTLSDLDGNKVRLSELKGKIVVLNFWATWCPPCIKEMPSLDQLHRFLRKQKFEVIAVSVDTEGTKLVRKFVNRGKFTFRVLIDSEKKTEGPFGLRGLPISYVIDHRGLMIAGAIGAINWSSKKAIAYFETLIKEANSPLRN